jgi:hypothetical protein
MSAKANKLAYLKKLVVLDIIGHRQLEYIFSGHRDIIFRTCIVPKLTASYKPRKMVWQMFARRFS